MPSLLRPPWHYPCCHHQSPFESTPLVCAACRHHHSCVFSSISPFHSVFCVCPLFVFPFLPTTYYYPVSLLPLHTNNSATTQTLWLSRKLTSAAAAAIRMPRCQGYAPSFVFWNIQLQKKMFELEKIAPTATQEKNPFSGGNLVPSECSFRPGQALRELSHKCQSHWS